MNPKCAKCDKTVYPAEKFSCLDQAWHKGCFRCEVCNMTLNLKNYKGLNKRPYCTPHYPKTQATAVSETPEMKRLAEQSKLQSQAEYHKDFNQSKKNFTVVADDPETRRLKANTAAQSSVKYSQSVRSTHGDAPRARAAPAAAAAAPAPVAAAPEPEPEAAYEPEPEAAYEPEPEAEAAPEPEYQEEEEAAEPAEEEEAAAPPAAAGGKYVALYDYTAEDADEISFEEGDFFINVEIIDEGWMTATVERTGATGMAPVNYAQACE